MVMLSSGRQLWQELLHLVLSRQYNRKRRAGYTEQPLSDARTKRSVTHIRWSARTGKKLQPATGAPVFLLFWVLGAQTSTLASGSSLRDLGAEDWKPRACDGKTVRMPRASAPLLRWRPCMVAVSSDGVGLRWKKGPLYTSIQSPLKKKLFFCPRLPLDQNFVWYEEKVD